MITLLICMGIGIVIGLILATAWNSSKGFGAFMGAIIGFFLGLLVAIIIGGAVLPSKPVLYHETELVALKDNSEITGSFFLGCGSIGSDFYYVFYEKSQDGKIRFNRLSASSDVSIVEEDRENGVLQEYRVEFVKDSYNKWGLCGRDSKYEIHIPKGSIVTGFKLDLE